MRAAVLTAASVLLSANAWAADPTASATGPELAAKADALNQSYRGQRARAVLTVETAEKPRKYEILQLWREGDGKTGTSHLLRVLSPPEMAKTALLVREHPGGRDERWLYLAGAQRVERIEQGLADTAVLGSDFSYEDLRFSVLADYTYQRVGEAKVDGRSCIEVERKPTFEGSAYGSTTVCYDTERGYPLRMRYFDRAGAPWKVALLSDYNKYGATWRAHRIVMKNLRTSRQSTYVTDKFELGLSLSEQLFTPNKLRAP